MSYYVFRSNDANDVGWIGPIRSRTQAHKESAAWVDAGWRAIVVTSSPAVRADVADWQRRADERLGRRVPRVG